MNLFIFSIFVCLVITVVTRACTLGQDTRAPTLRSSVLESGISNVQISVEHSECDSCKSCSQKSSYLLGSQKVTWAQAFVLCKQSGMELASVSSAEEENALENYIRKFEKKVGTSEGYWLAGTRHGACVSDFVWLTTGKPVIYRKFSAGQPDNSGGVEACLELFFKNPTDLSWNDIHCDSKLGFICQSSTCYS